MGTLLAGDVAVSLTAGGQPVATLMHPLGGSCQVLLGEARAISWRTPDGTERLAATEGCGGLGPAGLRGERPVEWSIEVMKGALEGGDDHVSVSVFAEWCDEGEAAAAARATFSLWPRRLALDLEIANGEEEQQDEEDAADGLPAEAASAGMDSGNEAAVAGAAAAPLIVACAIRGHCQGPPGSGESVQEAMAGVGLVAHLQDFGALATIDAPAGLAEDLCRSCVSFETAAVELASLLPGQTMTGGVALEAFSELRDAE